MIPFDLSALQLVVLLMAVPLGCAGVYLLYLARSFSSLGDRCEPVQAEVVLSTTVTSGDRPVVAYQYTVDGVTYESDEVAAGPPGEFTDVLGNEDFPRSVDGLSEGMQVDAYYDRENPARGLLYEPSGRLFFFAGSTFVGMAAVLVAVFIP